MTSIVKFGKEVVEVVTFDDKVNYDEDFEKSTLHIDHRMAKIFPKHIVKVLIIHAVRDIEFSDV